MCSIAYEKSTQQLFNISYRQPTLKLKLTVPKAKAYTWPQYGGRLQENCLKWTNVFEFKISLQIPTCSLFVSSTGDLGTKKYHVQKSYAG